MQGQNSGGFTLVELVVVLALFMLIISATVSIFITVVQHQKRILSQQEMLNQVSYAKEYMSRSMRSAVRDYAGNCLNDGQSTHPGSVYLLTHYNAIAGLYQGIKYITKDNVCQEFFLDTDDGTLKEKQDALEALSITSDAFTINSLAFIINGDASLALASSTDGRQPRVSILLRVKALPFLSLQDQVFQTTVSQRNLNLP